MLRFTLDLLYYFNHIVTIFKFKYVRIQIIKMILRRCIFEGYYTNKKP